MSGTDDAVHDGLVFHLNAGDDPATERAIRRRDALHSCHAANCSVHVPPRMFMCARHWGMVPKPLQRRIWKAYRPGQEQLRVMPSEEYFDAVFDAIDLVAAAEGIPNRRQRTNA